MSSSVVKEISKTEAGNRFLPLTPEALHVLDLVKSWSELHKIRRSVISSLLDNIENKKCVQVFAGHEQLETTLNSYYKDITDDNTLLIGMTACL